MVQSRKVYSKYIKMESKAVSGQKKVIYECIILAYST